MRIRIIKSFEGNRKGDVINVDNKTGRFLLKMGYGVISKDMTPDDYKQAGDKDGKLTQLHSYFRK